MEHFSWVVILVKTKLDTTEFKVVHNKIYFVGGVYCLRDSGVAEECFDLQKPVIKLLYYKEKNVLLSVTEDLTLCQHKVAPDSTLIELSKVIKCESH